MIENNRTIKHYIDSQVMSANDFIEMTKGVILGKNCNGQMRLIFISDVEELETYYNYNIVCIEESDSKLHVVIEE